MNEINEIKKWFPTKKVGVGITAAAIAIGMWQFAEMSLGTTVRSMMQEINPGAVDYTELVVASIVAVVVFVAQYIVPENVEILIEKLPAADKERIISLAHDKLTEMLSKEEGPDGTSN